MKLLWLDINSSYSHSSLALPALHSQLNYQTLDKIEWSVVNGTLKSDDQQIISQILKYSPDYIFSTGWLFNINYITNVLEKVHAINPDINIFLGGPEFLGNNEQFLRTNRYVASVFKGEAEEVFNEFILALKEETNIIEECDGWRNLPGFEYISDENIYISKESVIVKNFAKLSAPESSCFFNWDKPFVQIETSRGCFNSCRFCISGIDKSPVQDIDIEKLRERLYLIKSKGIKEVRVLDRTFNANSNRAIELLNLFNEFYPDIQFHIEVHPAMLSNTFKEAINNIPIDLLHLEAGIQSLSQDVISTAQRKGSVEKALEGLKYLVGTEKFQVHADLIAGLPNYTYKSLIEDTLILMDIGVQEIQIETLKLLPGTCFRNNSKDLEISFSPSTPYQVLSTKSITFDELRKAMVLSKIIDFWYNDIKWQKTFTSIFKQSPYLMETLIEKLHNTEYVTQPLSFESKSLLLYNFIKEHHPDKLFEISLQWINNGLSLKKEPANILKNWVPNNIEIENPIYIENDTRVKYFYAENQHKKYWFAFNPSLERNKPIIFALI